MLTVMVRCLCVVVSPPIVDCYVYMYICTVGSMQGCMCMIGSGNVGCQGNGCMCMCFSLMDVIL